MVSDLEIKLTLALTLAIGVLSAICCLWAGVSALLSWEGDQGARFTFIFLGLGLGSTFAIAVGYLTWKLLRKEKEARE